MCISIYKPQDKIISEEALRQCFKSNPDGAGYMWSENGNLHVRKGFFKFEDFYEDYKQHDNQQCVIHFRIKTHGKIDVENCHPFVITNNVAFIHNGTISGFGQGDRSDTYDFNEKVMKHLVNVYGKRVIQDEIVKLLIEEIIGWSKLVFLDSKGNYAIYNESKGNWDDGVWYSNSSYKVYQYQGYVPNRHKSYQTKQEEKDIIYLPKQKEYFVSKRNGEDIYVGDWVEVVYKTKALNRGEWVNVMSIDARGLCEVEDTEGNLHKDIDGTALAHPISGSNDILGDYHGV